METELVSYQKSAQLEAGKTVIKEDGVHCPMCLLLAGRRIRNKIYCGNCGFIES